MTGQAVLILFYPKVRGEFRLSSTLVKIREKNGSKCHSFDCCNCFLVCCWSCISLVCAQGSKQRVSHYIKTFLVFFMKQHLTFSVSSYLQCHSNCIGYDCLLLLALVSILKCSNRTIKKLQI